MDLDDETLMALADGEIDDEEAARLHALIGADPALSDRYALFARTSTLARDAALADPEAVVPPDLAARIRGMASTPDGIPQNVVPLRRPASLWPALALAASLAMAVGLTAGLFLAPDAPVTAGPALTADLQERLGTLPSGAEAELPDGRRMTVVASFTDGTGAFCREYETAEPGLPGYVTVACRGDEGWSLRFAVATGSDRTGYAPASSLEALDAFYTATDASQPLSAEAESAYLK
jgi:hypothetical protein